MSLPAFVSSLPGLDVVALFVYVFALMMPIHGPFPPRKIIVSASHMFLCPSPSVATFTGVRGTPRLPGPHTFVDLLPNLPSTNALVVILEVTMPSAWSLFTVSDPSSRPLPSRHPHVLLICVCYGVTTPSPHFTSGYPFFFLLIRTSFRSAIPHSDCIFSTPKKSFSARRT